MIDIKRYYQAPYEGCILRHFGAHVCIYLYVESIFDDFPHCHIIYILESVCDAFSSLMHCYETTITEFELPEVVTQTMMHLVTVGKPALESACSEKGKLFILICMVHVGIWFPSKNVLP